MYVVDGENSVRVELIPVLWLKINFYAIAFACLELIKLSHRRVWSFVKIPRLYGCRILGLIAGFYKVRRNLIRYGNSNVYVSRSYNFLLSGNFLEYSI